VPAYEYIQACLLHLIDVEWQPYDLSFVQEVNLPALYLGIAKGLASRCQYVKDNLPVLYVGMAKDLTSRCSQ
jgi:hypothetical protein